MIRRVVFLLDVENPAKGGDEPPYVSRLVASEQCSLHRVAGGIAVKQPSGRSMFYPDHVLKSVEYQGDWQ